VTASVTSLGVLLAIFSQFLLFSATVLVSYHLHNKSP
jgi:hypothetical protein